MHSVKSYAKLHGLTERQVRYHCANGNLYSTKMAGAGHGSYWIPENEQINYQKVGRKVGWRQGDQE